jgi:hypothetical protein
LVIEFDEKFFRCADQIGQQTLAIDGRLDSCGSRTQMSTAMAEAAMRSIARMTMYLMLSLATAAHARAQAPSEPQAFCVNRSADFYPYNGEPCKSGYQLGAGNCRKPDGRMVAVPREQCAAMAGVVELPFEGGRRPQPPNSTK